MLRKAIVAAGLPILVVVGLVAPATAKPTSCADRFSASVRREVSRLKPTNDKSVDKFGRKVDRTDDKLLACLTK